jgi:hypothetical protein
MTTLDAFYQNEQSTIVSTAIHDIESRLDEIENEIFCRNGIATVELWNGKVTNMAMRLLNLAHALTLYQRRRVS